MKQRITRYLLDIIPIVASSVTLLVFFIIDLCKGWNETKTVSYVFLLIVVVCAVSVYQPLISYILSNSKKMIVSNNELYRSLEEIDSLHLMMSLKKLKDNQTRDKKLSEINSLILKECPSFEVLSHSTVDAFFEKKQYLEKRFGFNRDCMVELKVRYEEYCELYSKDFEKMYSDYKTTKMIERQPFPVFNTLLPLALGGIGLFASIYQDIGQRETIKDSLLSYIILLLEFVIVGVFITIEHSREVIPALIKKNETIVKEITGIKDQQKKARKPKTKQ